MIADVCAETTINICLPLDCLIDFCEYKENISEPDISHVFK